MTIFGASLDGIWTFFVFLFFLKEKVKGAFFRKEAFIGRKSLDYRKNSMYWDR